MKKKLLFIIPTLDVGGAEKSLINLLNEIDYDRYEVDLFLMLRKGFLLNQVPFNVQVLPESVPFKNFTDRFHKSLLTFLKNGDLHLFWNKILFTCANRLYQNPVNAEQRNWKYLKYFFPELPKEYDAAIGYLEKNANYIAADCIRAKKKIGWIHTDLQQLHLDFDFEKKHFAKLDYIVTVSDGLKERLKTVMPECAEKIKTVENINSKKTIERLAGEGVDVEFDPAFINIVFVGRLEKVKGLDMALDAISILLKKKHHVRFYLIGDGSEKENLLQKANSLSIANEVFFLGIKANPYPYIKNANIYILTSHYEGKSISLEEAKILQKPIVVTDFSSANDQIRHEITGLIAQKNPKSIAEKIERLIKDKAFAESLIYQLGNQNWTENEIEKFYFIIEN